MKFHIRHEEHVMDMHTEANVCALIEEHTTTYAIELITRSKMLGVAGLKIQHQDKISLH